MKRHTHVTAAALAMGLTALSHASFAETGPDVYLNQNIGFDVEGYNYQQKEYPCNVDQVLVQKIVAQGNNRGLTVKATGNKNEIHNKDTPVLAIDINGLVLGDEEHSYGTRTSSNLPSVKIIAALIDKNRFKDGYVQANHSCAIASLNEFTPTSNVLDMGTAVTVCGAVERCLNDLGKDVVNWTQSQLK